LKKVLVKGSLNMDFVIDSDRIPVPGETLIGNSFSLVPGGKGANKAYALGKLGANVAMIGAVGNDDYGKLLLKNLNSVNVDTSGIVKLDNINTGCAFINVDASGENRIIVISGANASITKEIIDNNVKLIDEADIIVMQLEIPVDVVTYVAKMAKSKNKLVVLDPAPASNNVSDELFENVDIIKPNETEIQILSGLDIKNNDDFIKAAKILIDKGVKYIIVSLGENGSLLVTKEKIEKFDTIKVDVVDTTAAGDSFTAAIAKCLSEGKSIEEAIKFGHIVSSIVVTKKGAQTSIPDEKEMELFLDRRV